MVATRREKGSFRAPDLPARRRTLLPGPRRPPSRLVARQSHTSREKSIFRPNDKLGAEEVVQLGGARAPRNPRRAPTFRSQILPSAGKGCTSVGGRGQLATQH